MMCSNCENGCSWVGELRFLDDHLTTCGYTVLRCTNQCMENNNEVHVLRCDLDQHLKDKCPNRQHQCPHCKAIGRYCDITGTTHLDTCPKLEVPCPNTDCKAIVPHCDLANHRSKCQYEVVSCKYAEIGCKKKLLRNDLKQHENDGVLHLHLAVDVVSEHRKQISEQQKQINKQQEEISELQKEVKAVKEEQKMMSDNFMAGQVGPCVFNMTKYHRHKSSKQGWYSPPFHSHPEGYKMCIGVNANGSGAATGTHVSVFAYLMKGKNDDNLPWPFTGEVTITLLNQLADEDHCTRTISLLQDDKAGRVVVGERSRTGYGFFEFISHSQLDHGAAQNCQYLKDGCLFFQIKVQAAKPTKPWLTCTA